MTSGLRSTRWATKATLPTFRKHRHAAQNDELWMQSVGGVFGEQFTLDDLEAIEAELASSYWAKKHDGS